MTSVANEIAADIAKNYKFTEVEVGENISLDIYDDEDKRVKMFRMNFGKGSMERAHEDRAEDYGIIHFRLPGNLTQWYKGTMLIFPHL